MKKSTIVLIIICIVSLILGIIFSVASILSLKSFGMTKFGEFWDENTAGTETSEESDE